MNTGSESRGLREALKAAFLAGVSWSDVDHASDPEIEAAANLHAARAALAAPVDPPEPVAYGRKGNGRVLAAWGAHPDVRYEPEPGFDIPLYAAPAIQGHPPSFEEWFSHFAPNEDTKIADYQKHAARLAWDAAIRHQTQRVG